MTRCIIQPFKPSSCREWQPSLYQRECQQGLAQCWGLTVNPSGRVEGSKQSLLGFCSFVESVKFPNAPGHKRPDCSTSLPWMLKPSILSDDRP
jgi:hypothetical protein